MINEKIKFVSSGGNSIVMLLKKQAYQIFKYKSEYDKVLDFILELSSTNFVEINLTPQRTLCYSLFDHLSVMKNKNSRLQTIIWNRLKCLNELDTKDRIALVTRLIEKLIWDILKVIVGLNRYGYCHGDVSLDNIGYSQDHFVLYDYNMTRKSDDMRKDLVSFIRSIRFHLGEFVSSYIEDLLSFGYTQPLNNFVNIIREIHDFDTNDQAIDFLEKLKFE
jgi:hypothetical protein